MVTPPEFNLLANASVTLDEINNIARQHRIQASRFRVICLGREDVEVNNEQYIVYQLIVDSRDLRNIRRAIFQLYASKGGNTALFNPDVSLDICLICVVIATMDYSCAQMLFNRTITHTSLSHSR